MSDFCGIQPAIELSAIAPVARGPYTTLHTTNYRLTHTLPYTPRAACAKRYIHTHISERHGVTVHIRSVVDCLSTMGMA